MADDVTNQDQENQPQGEAGAADQESAGDEAAKPSLADKMKTAVDVQAEDVGTLRKKLTVTVPRDLLDEQTNEQYGELQRDAVVPGFRRGRAPRRLLEKRFGGDVAETLVQQLVTNGYLAAVEKLELKTIGDPLVFIKEKEGATETLVDIQKAIEAIELPAEGPLTFTCEVEVRPEFELPEVEGVPLEKPIITVSDEDVNRQVEQMRMYRGHYEPLPDGTVEENDVVYADVKMTCGETVLHTEENVRLAARPQSVQGVAFTKLGEVLAGAKVGDTRTTGATLPEDYENAELRGKEASLECRIHGINRLKLPELNEEFIKSIGFENLEDMRKYVRDEMESRIGIEISRGLRGQVQRYLLEKVTFDVPERLSDRQVSQAVVRRMYDLYNQGVPPAEVEKRMDELKTTTRETAVRDLKLAFIMEKMAEKVVVDVTEGEMNAYIANLARRQGRRFDRVREDLIKQGGATSLYLSLRDEKILDQIVAKAKITETTPQAGEQKAPDAT